MTSTDIHVSFVVPVTAEKASDAICRVSSWWTVNTVGSTSKLNDTFTVSFGETKSHFRITEMVPGKRINWLVEDCNLHWLKDKKEWKDTNILWEISSEGDKTRIDMTHVGLGPQKECFEDCTKGWTHYVAESLSKLITTGKGDPDHKDYSALQHQ